MKPVVVLLLSDKRSGSTIVQDELVKHSDIQHVHYSPHTYFETMHWLKAGSLLDMPKQTYYGHQVYSTFQSPKVADIYTRDCLSGNGIDPEQFKNPRDLVFRGWESLCQKFAQPVFFEKSPQYLAQWCCLSLILEWIRQTEFEVKILGLVRNPLSVMYSADQLFATDASTRQFGWADMYRNFITFQSLVPSRDFMTVRYEEMIDRPSDIFGEIQEFVGVSIQPEVGQGVHAKSREKWREDRYYSLELHESVKQVARKFGYSELDLSNTGKEKRKIGLTDHVKMYFRKKKASLMNRVVNPWRLRRKKSN